MKASWSMVLASSNCFRKLVGDMKECASKVSEGSGESARHPARHFSPGQPAYQSNTAVGNEDLYCMVTGMAVAMSSLAWHRKEIKTFSDLVCQKYGATQATIMSGILQAATVAIAGTILALAPGGGEFAAIIGGVVAVGAGSFFSFDIHKTWKLMGKKDEAASRESPFGYHHKT